LGYTDLTLSTFVINQNGLGCFPLEKFGREQHEDLLKAAARGEKIISFGMTEPSAGSDIQGIQTTARKVVDANGETYYRLSGEKHYIGNVTWADSVILFAKDAEDPQSMLCFVVPINSEGLRLEKEHVTMGLRGMVQAKFSLNNVKVSSKALLGDSQVGHAAMQFTRILFGSAFTGSINRCFDIARDYLKPGSEIDKYQKQSCEAMLSSGSSVLSELCAIVTKASLDQYKGDSTESPFYTSMVPVICKVLTSELLCVITNRLVLATNEIGDRTEISRLLRDSRVARIYEGPTATLVSTLHVNHTKLQALGWCKNVLSSDDYKLVEKHLQQISNNHELRPFFLGELCLLAYIWAIAAQARNKSVESFCKRFFLSAAEDQATALSFFSMTKDRPLTTLYPNTTFFPAGLTEDHSFELMLDQHYHQQRLTDPEEIDKSTPLSPLMRQLQKTLNPFLEDERRTISPGLILSLISEGVFSSSYDTQETYETLGSASPSLAVLVAQHHAARRELDSVLFDAENPKICLVPTFFTLRDNYIYCDPTWCFAPAWATHFLLFGEDTKGEVSVFLASKTSSTINIDHSSSHPTLGLRGLPLQQVKINGFPISDCKLVGRGVDRCRGIIQRFWVSVSMSLLGSMRNSYSTMHRYVSRRLVKGKPLIESALVRLYLHSIQTSISSLEYMIRSVSVDSGRNGFVRAAALKVLASNLAKSTADYALQFLGGRGFMEPNLISKAYRDTTVIQVLFGSNSALLNRLGGLETSNATMNVTITSIDDSFSQSRTSIISAYVTPY